MHLLGIHYMVSLTMEAKTVRRSQRNIIHLGLVFFFIFFAYVSLECFQSSINFEGGLGTFSLSMLYGVCALSSLFIGPAMVVILKPKRALFVALFGHTLYIAANFQPTWVTLMVASAVLGAVTPVIWISQSTYINNTAMSYCDNRKQAKLSHTLSKYNGMFMTLFGWSYPFGSLVSAVILSFTSKGSLSDSCNNTDSTDITVGYVSEMTTVNVTVPHSGHMKSCVDTHNITSVNDICGANHCPYMQEHLEVLEKPDRLLIYLLMSIFLVFNLSGIILCLFLPKLPEVGSSKPMKVKQKLLLTLKVMKKLDLWLLMTGYLMLGILKATVTGSFTQVRNKSI